MSAEQKDLCIPATASKLDELVKKLAENEIFRKNVEFAKRHATSRTEHLLHYLQKSAQRLGHSPGMYDVIGGPYILSRFSSWDAVLEAAELPPCAVTEREKSVLYLKEYRRQKKLLLKRERVPKAERIKRRQERADEKRREKQIRRERDMAWGASLSDSDDASLLEYLRQTAEELGHTPYVREVLGGIYISQHFGSWPLALTLAGLPFPSDLKPLTPKELHLLKQLEQANAKNE